MPSNHHVKIPKSDAGLALMAVKLLTVELTALSVLGRMLTDDCAIEHLWQSM